MSQLAEFSYQAADANGRKTDGRLTASSKAEALRSLQSRGLYPLRLAENVAPKSAPPDRRAKRGGDLLVFTQQIATLAEAGLQLDRSLSIMADLDKGTAWGDMIADIRRDIQRGAAFSAALASRPGVFGRIYVNMVRAGETGGVLPLVLRRLAQTLEEEQELRSFILGAVLYPIIVATVSMGAAIFLMLFVVPRFEFIFSQLDQPVPVLTRITLAISRGLKAYGLWILLVLIATAAGFWRLIRTPGGRRWLDRVCLDLPLFGDLYLKLQTAKIARTLAMLSGAGVSVLQAFAVVRETVANSAIASSLARAGREIKEGGGIARRLEAQKVLPAMAVSMIAVGEETGRLPAMLEQVAKGYDVEVKRSVRKLLSLLEPALILLLTAITLLIALSILLPIISISTSI